MDTQIELWSQDGSVDLSQINLLSFITQATHYFNSFGHLPPIGCLVAQDQDSPDDQSVLYIVNYQYSGQVGDKFVIHIDLSTDIPVQYVRKAKKH